MKDRYEAANQIPGWSARMDAMLVLIKEDPVEYLVVAREFHRAEIKKEMGLK
jgi:hypothetical protein